MSAADQILVFDMDGVLVDVTGSYRETIIRTVEIFTGKKISRELIQDYKNQGGWNNDWALSQKICRDLGVEVEYETIVDHFMDLFLNQGLINNERWIPRVGLLEKLSEKSELGIFTGRSTLEATITLEREGWMKWLHPHWSSAKVDTAGLTALLKTEQTMRELGYVVDAGPVRMYYLSDKLRAKLGAWDWLVGLNPMAGVVEGFRWAMLGSE